MSRGGAITVTLEGTIAGVREDLLKGRLGEQGVCVGGWGRE